jgi:hypothetical protein
LPPMPMEAGLGCIPDSLLSGQLQATDPAFNIAKDASLNVMLWRAYPWRNQGLLALASFVVRVHSRRPEASNF